VGDRNLIARLPHPSRAAADEALAHAYRAGRDDCMLEIARMRLEAHDREREARAMQVSLVERIRERNQAAGHPAPPWREGEGGK
jgi:hypothetical protein